MFDEAISYDKVNAWAYLERGKVYLAKGKTSRAEPVCRRHLRSDIRRLLPSSPV
jgi:hypothetical protein